MSNIQKAIDDLVLEYLKTHDTESRGVRLYGSRHKTMVKRRFEQENIPVYTFLSSFFIKSSDLYHIDLNRYFDIIEKRP